MPNDDKIDAGRRTLLRSALIAPPAFGAVALAGCHHDAAAATADAPAADAGAADAGGGCACESGSTIPQFLLGPEQDQYASGVNMAEGTINPFTSAAIGSYSVIKLKGADNQGTRIAGIDATNATPDRTVLLFRNESESGHDCGQVVFKHLDAAAAAANQIWCPGNIDYLLPMGGAVFAVYGADNFWHLISEGGTAKYVTTTGLRFYPSAVTPMVSGVVNDWNPAMLGNFGSGGSTDGGLSGGDLSAMEYALITVQVATGGATLTGFVPQPGNNTSLETLGAVKILINERGGGPLTLAHFDARSSDGLFNCPGGVDYALQPGQAVMIVRGRVVNPGTAEDFTWSVLGAKADMTRISATASLGAAPVNDWVPVDGTSGVPLSQANWVSVSTPLGGATINTINPTRAGHRVTLSNVGASTLTLAHNQVTGTTGKRIFCPGGTSFALQQFASVDLAYDGDEWVVLSSRVGGA